MTTWGDMLDAVRREIEETTENIWSDTSLRLWCNEAMADFTKKTLILEDEQYTDSNIGQESYSLPSGTLDVVSVYWADDSDPLQRLTTRDYFAMSQDGSSGSPQYYCIFHDTLLLYPVPDVEDEIRFFRNYLPGDVSATTDELDVTGHDPAIRNFIKARAYEQIGDYTSSDRAQMLYDREVEETSFENKRSHTADEPLMPQMRW